MSETSGVEFYDYYYYYWILIIQESKMVKPDLYCACILLIMNDMKGNCSIGLVLIVHFLIVLSLSISEIERVVHSKKSRQEQSS